MRLFFIPGLGEEPYVFDKIAPALHGEQIFIDNWVLLKDLPEEGLTVLEYAEYLIARFAIGQQDVVIGHSMGGWVALQIKQLVQSTCIQVASWTNGSKVITVPLNRETMYKLAKKGFGFNPIVLRLLVLLNYQHMSSKGLFKAIFRRMMHGDKSVVAKQLMICFNPLKSPITVAPDFRIHGTIDKIIDPPDEPYYMVPGDHFGLYTYPEIVSAGIVAFLDTGKEKQD